MLRESSVPPRVGGRALVCLKQTVFTTNEGAYAAYALARTGSTAALVRSPYATQQRISQRSSGSAAQRRRRRVALRTDGWARHTRVRVSVGDRVAVTVTDRNHRQRATPATSSVYDFWATDAATAGTPPGPRPVAPSSLPPAAPSASMSFRVTDRDHHDRATPATSRVYDCWATAAAAAGTPPQPQPEASSPPPPAANAPASMRVRVTDRDHRDRATPATSRVYDFWATAAATAGTPPQPQPEAPSTLPPAAAATGTPPQPEPEAPPPAPPAANAPASTRVRVTDRDHRRRATPASPRICDLWATAAAIAGTPPQPQPEVPSTLPPAAAAAGAPPQPEPQAPSPAPPAANAPASIRVRVTDRDHSRFATATRRRQRPQWQEAPSVPHGVGARRVSTGTAASWQVRDAVARLQSARPLAPSLRAAARAWRTERGATPARALRAPLAACEEELGRVERARRARASEARERGLRSATRFYRGYAAHAVSGGVEASSPEELAAREAEKEANLLPAFPRGVPSCVKVDHHELVRLGRMLVAAGHFDDPEIVEMIAGWDESGGIRAYGEPLRRTYDYKDCPNAPMDVPMLAQWHSTFSKEWREGWVTPYTTRADLETVVRFFRVNKCFFVAKMHDGAQKTKDNVLDPVTNELVDGVPCWRLCEHMSAPKGVSLNDTTSMGWDVKLQDVDAAAAATMRYKRSGHDVEYWKGDESGAYRNYPLADRARPSFVIWGLDPRKPFPAAADLDVDAHGIVRLRPDQCCYMMRNTLPFGWAKSVSSYVRIARLVQALHLSPVTPLATVMPPCRGGCSPEPGGPVPASAAGAAVPFCTCWHTSMRYIDDTLGIALKGMGALSKARFFELMHRLRIPISMEKDEEEGAVEDFKSFLGVILTASSETMAMSPARLAAGLKRLRDVAAKAYLPRKELESLIGVLSFCAKTCPAGRTFMRRMFDALKRHTKFTRLSRGIKSDIAWWLAHWVDMDGVSLMIDDFFTSAERLGLFTDASLDGYGASFVLEDGTCEFFGGTWRDLLPGIDTSQAAKAWHISELEAVAVVMAAHQWGHRLAARRVAIRVDNESCVTAFNKGRARDPGMMCCIRDLWFAKAKHSFELGAIWIATKDNVMGDAPSRWTRPDGTRDPGVEREFYNYAREQFGVAAGDMHEVPLRFDATALLRKMEKSHRLAGASAPI